MSKPRGTVSLPFRIVGYVLGPVMVLAGVGVPVALLWSLVQEGGKGAPELWWMAVVMLGGIPLGLNVLRAARTGRDPYVDDPDA